MLEGRWHCSPKCLEEALTEQFEHLVAATGREVAPPHRIPLGLLMLSQGLVSHDKLKEALHAQRASGGGRVGDWLRHLGAVTEEQITRALGMQWSLPVFPLNATRNYLECADLVPLPVLEHARMVPAHFIPASRHLYMAFADRIDYTALCAVEKMLECRAEPCLAPQTAIERALNEFLHRPRPAELVFDIGSDLADMARTTRRYACELEAEEVRLAACTDLIWVRTLSRSGISNLLFRLERCRQRTARTLDARA